MSFPSSPINGQTTEVNGITYVYNSTNNAWKRVPLTSLSVSGSVTAGSISTNNLVWSGNGQPFVPSFLTAVSSYDLDDLSTYTDGFRITFSPTYNLSSVSITHPNQLTVAVNGVLLPSFVQTANTEIVWQSYVFAAYKGYTIDSTGNIKFAEAPPSGSQLYARTTGSAVNTTIKTYPFKPIDIMAGI